MKEREALLMVDRESYGHERSETERRARELFARMRFPYYGLDGSWKGSRTIVGRFGELIHDGTYEWCEATIDGITLDHRAADKCRFLVSSYDYESIVKKAVRSNLFPDSPHEVMLKQVTDSLVYRALDESDEGNESSDVSRQLGGLYRSLSPWTTTVLSLDSAELPADKRSLMNMAALVAAVPHIALTVITYDASAVPHLVTLPTLDSYSLTNVS